MDTNSDDGITYDHDSNVLGPHHNSYTDKHLYMSYAFP